jgi:NAD(P)-dependent dehydrogenase (short-subunit alcohol dehydrogenase family)
MTDQTLPLSSRIALVTGASRGIGRACAVALAKAGAHIVATGRTQGALEELDDEILAATGDRTTLVPMDLAEGDNVDHLALAIHQRFGRLDILVNAAAQLGNLTPVSHVDPKLWDALTGLNFTAVARLIRAFEPLLRQSQCPRAIFLTSSVAAQPRAFWGPYAATKAGMEALVRSWADEVEISSIRAVLLDPGAMRTRMRAAAVPGEDPMTLPHPDEIGPLIVDLAQSDLGLPHATVAFRTWKAERDILPSLS